MAIGFDPHKSSKNKTDPSRGFGLELAQEFAWESCVTYLDTRKDYGETRYISLGFVQHRLHVLVWTARGDVRWIISLRKANARERKRYEKDRG